MASIEQINHFVNLKHFEQLKVYMIPSFNSQHHLMPPVVRRNFPEQNKIPGERKHHKNENIKACLNANLQKIFLFASDNFNKKPSVQNQE